MKGVVPLDVVPVSAFKDNYVWTMRDATHAAVVDPGEARPVLETLLAGRVILTPRLDAGDPHMYDVRIPLTTRGIIQEFYGSQGVASPTGFEPVF